MARVEKNAAGEDVRVDTPEYGCIVVPAKKAAPVKTKPGAKAPADEGEK